MVGFHGYARETAARRLGAGGEIEVAAALDRDQQAARAQHADGAARGVTTNCVENHIHAIDVRGEVGGDVVDELVAAQAGDEVVLAGARGTDDAASPTCRDGTVSWPG